MQPKQKESENCYLEHWLKENGIENAQFFVGKFYEGIKPLDRPRLEADNKVLAFTNGKDGYFTDPQTAQLMTAGDVDRGINPIYAADRNSPHNVVAYGSLIASDGLASTEVKQSRILVIDDEKRSHGSETLTDRQGKPIPQAELEKLYDKMGDGTMLVSRQAMTALILPEERDAIAERVFKKAGISSDISDLAGDYSQLDEASQQVDRQTNALVQRTVTQFRAATPDLPGIIKGTMATSEWCERLGVDAIISKNDIKGDDGRLSSPGIKAVESFWLNRKSDGTYGEQVVGPQVKGCIPDATLTEFNPRMQAQAEEVAQIANSPQALLQYYVQQKDKQREIVAQGDEEGKVERPDWLYDIAQSDLFGVLTGFSKINRELDRFVRGERVDNAVGGIYVPSAMAQHHSQLEPWEVCNRDLPHGSVVAYYRSPFPNVGAAAIAINNTEVIKQEDPESFKKDGVAYLNPWTAKNVAITDFDKDANGFFVGFQATVLDLPEQIREQLATVPPAEQYEAGRALFGEMIERMQSGEETRLEPAQSPIAVKELIDRNDPDQKPPEIIKQKKIKHPWQEGESHAAATWRAWEITANNPTGMVANCGIILQSLAQETQFTPVEKKEALLKQISSHYQKLLEKSEDGKLHIPSDEELTQKGFPTYSFQARIADLAQANKTLQSITDPQQRLEFVHSSLNKVHRLLSDFVEGPNAENLQTAVDTAKSSRGIDKDMQEFGKALAHKEHDLRQHQKDPTVYIDGKVMPTNTDEPIGWAVETSNRLYQDTQLPELKNEAFRDLFPKNFTLEQEEKALTIAKNYNQMIQSARADQERLREKRPEDQQPTLTAKVLTTGSEFTIQRPCNANPEGDLPIWDRTRNQTDWSIVIERNPKPSDKNPEALRAKLVYFDQAGHSKTSHLGFIAPESVEKHHLLDRLQSKDDLTIQASLEINPPLALQNDTKDRIARSSQYLKEAIAQIPDEERMAYASALWRHSEAMGIALKALTPEVCQQLQSIPEITLTGIQRETNQIGQILSGEYTVRFSELSYVDQNGENRRSPSVAIVGEDGNEQQFGALSPRSVHLPMGTTVTASICIDESGKTARMQVIDLATAPEAPEADRTTLNETSPMTAEENGRYGVSDRPSLSITTDGACSGNPGSGGWGAILIQGDIYREIGGAVANTTNNRMELTAGIEALKYARAERLLVDGSTPIKITSDSQLFIKGATGEWSRNANRDLWTDYDQVSAGVKVEFEWVKGHNGHPLNERADEIATAFAKGKQLDLRQSGPTVNSYSDNSVPEQASFSEEIKPTGKPVKMVFPLKMHGEENPLPVNTCIDAMRGHGRCHTTRSFEPHAAYGFKEGDIAIAVAGDKQVAFRVGEQYRITPEMMADPEYQKQWAAMEKQSPKELQSFQGKQAWGLKMEPLGDFVNGKVVPFSQSEAEPQSYCPSRQELLDWYKAAKVAKEPDLERIGEIKALGVTLKKLYNLEHGSPSTPLTPPTDYQHPAVEISSDDRQQMQKDIQAARRQQQVAAAQAER